MCGVPLLAFLPCNASLGSDQSTGECGPEPVTWLEADREYIVNTY
jgi:hypothetical protein